MCATRAVVGSLSLGGDRRRSRSYRRHTASHGADGGLSAHHILRRIRCQDFHYWMCAEFESLDVDSAASFNED